MGGGEGSGGGGDLGHVALRPQKRGCLLGTSEVGMEGGTVLHAPVLCLLQTDQSQLLRTSERTSLHSTTGKRKSFLFVPKFPICLLLSVLLNVPSECVKLYCVKDQAEVALRK